MHRKFPGLYRGGTDADLEVAKKKLNYVDIYAAVAAYYVVGNWTDIGGLAWRKAEAKTRADLAKLVPGGREWMSAAEYGRLCELMERIGEIQHR